MLAATALLAMPDIVIKRENTKAALLLSAKTLFQEKGYESVSANDIAARAGVSRKTFFNYFRSKDLLLQKMAVEWHRQHVPSLLPISPHRPALGLLREAFIAHMDLMPGHQAMFELLVNHSQMIEIHQAILLPDEEPAHPIQRDMLMLFRRAHAQGELKPGISAVMAYQAYITLHNLMPHIWVNNPGMGIEQLRDKAGCMLDIFFHGCTAPGQPPLPTWTATHDLPVAPAATGEEHPVVPPIPLTSEKMRDTYRRIIEAALGHFRKHGYEGSSIDSIASHAGISRKTFFNYFQSKNDLLYYCTMHWYHETVLVQAPPLRGSTALDQLRNAVFDRYRLLSGHRDFVALVLDHLTGFLGIREALLPDNGKPTDTPLQAVLGLCLQAHANGELAAGVTAESVFHAYVSLRAMTLHTWARHPDTSADSLLQITQPMMDILLHGCAASGISRTG